MIPVSYELGRLNSVVYLSALSLSALVAGHWSAWQAARVEEAQQEEKRAIACSKNLAAIWLTGPGRIQCEIGIRSLAKTRQGGLTKLSWAWLGWQRVRFGGLSPFSSSASIAQRSSIPRRAPPIEDASR